MKGAKEPFLAISSHITSINGRVRYNIDMWILTVHDDTVLASESPQGMTKLHELLIKSIFF